MKFWTVLAVVSLVGCVDTGRSPPVSVGPHDGDFCTDGDGDGFGEGCALGGDCNDTDPAIHQGCLSCVRPAEGCACDNSRKPISCYLEPSANEDGGFMCHEGTRYCREGAWSACESIFSYPKPVTAQPQALVNPDAGTEKCSDCRPNCFIVRDNLNPTDSGLGDAGVQTQIGDGGGLSITTYVVDSGPMDASTYDASGCMIGAAPDKDCDGVLDQYDPYPTQKPFATTNPTLFLDLAPGATGTGVINLAFYLNSADVYFLLDQTGSMETERMNLVAGLTTGDYVNSAAYKCSDYDFDGSPNNELKTKGVIGAIRCYIRDANFGAGFFREIPFDARGGWGLPYQYGHEDELAFRNFSDITADVTKVSTGVSAMTTALNLDWEEAAMPALYTVASGNGMYFGVDKFSIPTRTSCPANTFGYPCFRKDAIPIVVLFTDAPTHHGPSNNTLPYDAAYLDITRNTGTTSTEAAGNESFLTAKDAADVTNSYVTYGGNTTGMASNSGTTAFTCANQASAPDAFYKFSLTSTKNVTISTEGSQFDTVLALWKGIPSASTAVPSYPNTNDSFADALNLGDVGNKYLQAMGNSSSLKSDYLANDLGCSAYSGSPDAAFKFTLTTPTRVALDTIGSSIGTSLSLFSGTPTLPTYTAITNNNDKLASPYTVPGTINGFVKAFSGNTNTSPVTITPDYTAAQLGCSPADNSPDAVYQFTVGGAATTRVRVSAEDSTLDTVLALLDNSGSAFPTTYTNYGNDTVMSAQDLGPLDGKTFKVIGDTSQVQNTYANNLIGCNSTSRDAVVKFTLNSTRTVQIDTANANTAIDTVVALFKGSVTDSATSVTGLTTWENLNSAGNPGTVNTERYVISGSTSGMAADYLSTQMGACTTAASASPDAVYKLHLANPTTVRLDTNGSSFDTVMSLHSALPDQVSTPITTGDTVTGAYAIGNATNRNAVFTNMVAGAGTTNFAPDVAINSGTCFSHAAAPDAVLSFSIATAGMYQIDTIGSGFDTVLGIFDQAVGVSSLPTATAVATAGDTSGGATDVGPIIGTTWKSYTGNTVSGTGAEKTDFTDCGAVSNGKDIYYKFNVTSTQTITIDTIGTGYDTVLGVFKSDGTKYPGSMTYCNDNGANPGDSITASFISGTYYAVIKGKTSGATGNYKITFKGSGVTNPISSCDDNGGASNTSKLTLNMGAGNYYAVVKGKAAGDKGTYKLAIKHLDFTNAGGTVLGCNDNATASDTYSLYQTPTALAAGDYYVVLKGKTGGNASGNYVLTMQDVGTQPDGWIDCNDNASASTTTSLLTETLGMGTYYVVIKGRNGASPTKGNFGVDITDTTVGTANVLQCDYNSGPGGTSAIERDLSPGTYRVIVKGKGNAEKNAYKLQIRDVTSVPAGTGRLNCNYNSGTGGKSYLEQDLNAGTYTVLLKGDSGSASGIYKLGVRDATNINGSETPLYCNNDVTSGTETSKISNKSLTAGTYYVGVKGYNTANSGYYQVSFGAGATASAKYVPPAWSTTLAELVAKKIRVIPILSCKDDLLHGNASGDCNTARTQYTALANATGALGSNGSALIYDLDSVGNGLSGTVVKGITSLAQYLEMNVSARVVFDPDANPGFTLLVKAVDVAGDGCDGIIGSEHQKCLPGATPRFEISFTNPAGSPVPLNSPAKDPNGGYNFRAELIANNQFIVDKVPIYIIPQAVTNLPPPPKFYPTGSYTQNLAANGCAGKTDLPDWNELSWDATIPNGTSVSFSVCAGMSAAALATCTPTPICTITGGAACSASSPCPTGSFCSAAGNCNAISGNSCTSNANCPSSATCQSNKCVYDGQPIDLGEILGSTNFEPNLKVLIGLTANTTTNVGPTVQAWTIDYLCKNSL
jgi:hypothetical protein